MKEILFLKAVVIGFFLNSHFNNPRYLLRNSVSILEKKPFNASVEGQESLGDSVIAKYRYRQAYTPSKGITTISVQSGTESQIPFNTLFYLGLLKNPLKVKEDDRQDMYGHPTRHFNGVFDIDGTQKGSISSYFEYWIDMRNQRPVRLTISIVSRNAIVNVKGDSLSAVTYLNFRFTQ